MNGVNLTNVVFRPQLEIGNIVSDFEVYNTPQTINADSDGSVVGFTSLSPTTSLTTDFSGVIITMEYYKDADKAFEEQILNIAMTGGI